MVVQMIIFGYCDEAGGEDFKSCPVDDCSGYVPENGNGICDYDFK